MAPDTARPWHLPATELAARVRAGELSPTEAVSSTLDRIEVRDDTINAYVTVTRDEAMAAARRAEAALAAGEDVGPLCGVPVGLKDLRALKEGVRHTYGSVLFADNVAERTAVIVERLEAAGAIVVGKTNTPAFGHRGTTTNEIVGPTVSPVEPSLNAGGSSGGSAAAVAAGMASLATGSDAGGSIRIPAAACGVYGFKPSYGLVPVDSRPNAFGQRLHHTALGPLARTVADAALALDVMAGPHPRDPGSVPVDVDFQAGLDRPVDGMKVAYSPDLDVFPVADAVRDVVEDSLAAFESADATVESVTVDHGLSLAEMKAAVATTFSASVVGGVETIRETTGLDLREHPDEVPESMLELVAMGDQRDAADVATTGLVRTAVFDAVQSLLDEYDVLVTPTLGVSGFESADALGPDEWEVALTWPLNWTGHPAASVPAGRTAEGHPVGLQVVGPRYEDDVVIAASAAFERNRPWYGHYPR